MGNENLALGLRRSSRVPAELPILVTSLAGTYFSEVCKTLVVNAHGCALRTPVKFDPGILLRFHCNDGRETTARVVFCQPIGPGNRTWKLGAQLDRPGNFWGLKDYPKDWAGSASVLAGLPQLALTTGAQAVEQTPKQASQTFEAKLDVVVQRLEAPLKRMIAESLSPLETDVAALKETAARQKANPSRFEVSLSSIPPELEQQIETRLRNDIGPKVLQDSRQQYAQLLETAKSTIDRQTNEGYEAFVRRVREELKVVEKRAEDLSVQISAKADERLATGVKDFQQKLLDGGNALKRLSEELLEFLQNSLNDLYNAHREELELVRASVAAESTRLRKEVESLDRRVARLDESSRSLESGLDKRLNEMASKMVKDARTHFESAAAETLDQLTARSRKIVEDRLAETSENLATTEKGMLASFSEALNVQAKNAEHAFEQSMGGVAKGSVERWRHKLSDGLNALAKSVGEQFKLDTESSDGDKDSRD